MPDDLTPDQPASDPAPAAPASPAGQSNDFEARYKGLQRQYNTLETTVKNKDAALLALQQQLDATKMSSSDAYTQLQTTHTELQSQFNQTKTAAEQHQAKVKELETALNATQSQATQRKALIAAQGSDLLEAFEDGDLNIAGLEGEALSAKLTSFRARAARIATQQFGGAQQTTPPQPSTPSANGLTFDQLYDWVNDAKNFTSPQFDSMHEAFLSLVSKQPQQ